jgi:hypothetical protein
VSCTSGSNKSFETGMITTQNWNGSSPYFGYTYGAAEARIWLPTPTNRGTSGPTTTTSGPVADWPAWWAPGTGEIDIMEGLGGTTCWHVHNSAYTLAGGSCPSAPSGATGWGGEWHTYASVWANGTVTFYYDGANAGTETSAELGATTPLGAQQKYLVLAMQTDGSTELTYPATMYVDYVRVWKQ